MNHDFLIKTTNRIAVYATLALLYWVFTFLIITVFDLKIFRERMTEMFFLSLLGIFAILGGAIVLNVMSNLSKISAAVSEKHGAAAGATKLTRFRLAVFALLFPLIAAGLFAGNKLSDQRKQNLLISSAQRLVSENQAALTTLSDYKFSSNYIKKAEKILDVIKKIDKNLPEVTVIVPDSIDGKKLFLSFGGGHYYDKKEVLEMSSFIFSASQEEREYLEKIFSGNDASYKFHADSGSYQLYFPVTISGRKVVLYFSENQRYGGYGS
jgi:hypothetical protein